MCSACGRCSTLTPVWLLLESSWIALTVTEIAASSGENWGMSADTEYSQKTSRSLLADIWENT